MIGAPIIVREVRAALRRRWTAVAAALYAAVLSVLLVWLWPEQGLYTLAAQSSRALVGFFASALLLATVCIAPAFSATAIVSEKERGTFDLLFHTLLRPQELAIGKLLSSLAILGLFAALGFPFFAATFLLGAVSAVEAAGLYGVIALTAVGAALIGLILSAHARDSHVALIRAYAALVGWLAAPWAVAAILGARPDWAALAWHVRAASPIAALLSVLRPPPAGLVAPPAWRLFLLYTAVGAGGGLAWLMARLHQPPAPPRREERVIDDRHELLRRRFRFPFYLIDPQRRKRLLGDRINPVFAREMRARAMGGGAWLLRGLYGCFALSAVLVILLAGRVSEFTPDQLKGVAVAFQIGLVALLGPALTAGAITREIESGGFDALRMTRLRAGALLAGKTQVAGLFVLFLLVGAAPLWTVIHIMELNTPREMGLAAGVILATLGFALAAGFFGSAWVRHSAGAAALAYGIVFVVVIATLLPHLAPDRFAPAIRRAFQQANPLLVAWSALRTDGGERLDAVRHIQGLLLATALLGGLSYVRLLHRFAPDP